MFQSSNLLKNVQQTTKFKKAIFNLVLVFEIKINQMQLKED